MNVLGMKVSWNIGWMNLPTLNMLLDEEPPPPEVWHRHEVEGGSYYFCRRQHAVSFLFESLKGGGALARKVTLEDGTEHQTNGGWSSNEGAVNKLRALDPDLATYLPEDVVGITYYGKYAREGTYNDGWGLGIAGVGFEVSWVIEQMRVHLPGVELLDLTDRGAGAREDQASADQALIFGATAYGYIPVPADRPVPLTKEAIKPSIDSELFQRTAMEHDRKRARQLRERGAT